MSIWWALPIFVGLVGVLLLVGGIAKLVKLRLVSGGLRFLFGGAVLGIASVVGLIGLNLQTYARLTHEQLAAEVTLKQTGVQAFVASVSLANPDGKLQAPKDYALTGDAFRMEADVVTFAPWANIIGADAMYKFNRIQGRFDSEAQENATPPMAMSMRDNAGIDLFAMGLGDKNPLRKVDAEFMDGAAVPMADGATYTIHMSQRGLIPRPKNEAATKAVQNWRGNRRYDDPVIQNQSPVPAVAPTAGPTAAPTAAPVATPSPRATP